MLCSSREEPLEATQGNMLCHALMALVMLHSLPGMFCLLLRSSSPAQVYLVSMFSSFKTWLMRHLYYEIFLRLPDVELTIFDTLPTSLQTSFTRSI